MKTFFAVSAAAVAALAGHASAAIGEAVYGMTGSAIGTSLVVFPSHNPAAITNIGMFSGMKDNQVLRAMDFRPATGELYALSVAGRDAQLYTVNLNTAALTPVGPGFSIVGNGFPARVSMDFNPTVDRLRIVTGSGQNMRVNPNTGGLVAQDGALQYAAGDIYEGQTPFAVGAAYTNNYQGATTTTLYGWDFNHDALAIQSPPNSGTWNTVGTHDPSLVTDDGGVGFDISGFTGEAYMNFRALGTTTEYFATVDLATSSLTLVGEFNGVDMLDIAVYTPAPSAAALLGLGGLVAGRRRR